MSIQPIKAAFSTFSQQIEENRQFSGYYKKLSIPPTPKGSQQFKYEIGQPVTFSDLSPIRGTGKVIDRFTENGFCYYRISLNNGKAETIAREKDLK